MKSSELKNESTASLNIKVADLQKELVKLNAQRATGAVPKSPRQIRVTRRNIARIKGILREQQLQIKANTIKTATHNQSTKNTSTKQEGRAKA